MLLLDSKEERVDLEDGPCPCAMEQFSTRRKNKIILNIHKDNSQY